MADFVDGCAALILFGNNTAALFRACNDLHDRFLDLLHADLFLFTARGQNRRFVHDVFKVCTDETDGSSCNRR